MRKERLAEYENKYVGLRLSSGDSLCCKLKVERTIGKEPSLFFLEEAMLFPDPSIGLDQSKGSALEVYLDTIPRKQVEEGYTLIIYEIAPEHVTIIKDISQKVKEAMLG